MENNATRWLQRFDNYKRAFARLKEACFQVENLQSDLEKDGLVQRFEFTYELAWKVLKDYIAFAGFEGVLTPRDVQIKALEIGLITDGPGWKSMQEARNRASHEYNSEAAEQLFSDILANYFNLLDDVYNTMLKHEASHKA